MLCVRYVGIQEAGFSYFVDIAFNVMSTHPIKAKYYFDLNLENVIFLPFK